MAGLGVRLENPPKGGFMVLHNYEKSLVVRVKSKKNLEPLLMKLKEAALSKSNGPFFRGIYGVLRYQGRLCILDVDGLIGMIKEEAHSSRYSIHLGTKKMYRDI